MLRKVLENLYFDNKRFIGSKKEKENNQPVAPNLPPNNIFCTFWMEMFTKMKWMQFLSKISAINTLTL